MPSSGKNLRNNILRTIAYFDVFEYPLTAEQIFSFLHQNVASVADSTSVADTLVLEGKLSKEKKYFYLQKNDNRIVEKRLSGEKRAKKMLSFARIISAFIKQVPFIRGIFITGSLSKDFASPSSDIDFMIVTTPERLWICKTFLTVFRKIFLFGSPKYFCTNFYVTPDGYTMNRKNYYTAIEVATTKVMWNVPAFHAFQEANSWTKEFLPNWTTSIDHRIVLSHSRSFFQRFFEVFLNLLPLSRIDQFLMNQYQHHWNKFYHDINEKQRAESFRTSPNVSSVWKIDYQGNILKKYRNTLTTLVLKENDD